VAFGFYITLQCFMLAAKVVKRHEDRLHGYMVL
jgi:hypothetical protein